MKPKPGVTLRQATPGAATGDGQMFSWWWFGLSAALAVLAYAPTFRAGLVWNDADYVTSAGLRSWAGLGRIWTEVGATEQYYPVLHSAFWLQYRAWGDAPLGYHVVNLGLHLAAAGLFGLALRRLRVAGAWLGAAIFVLHPVCVESVAWVSEQKNTLSTVFFLGAALAYFRFNERRAWGWYAAATGLFLAALLSKSLTAVLPPALLVVSWWREGKLEWRKHVLPLAPWFAVGAAVGLFTAWVEHTYLGATGADFELSWLQRGLLAGRIVWFYVGKLVWPVGQVFIYPRWQIEVGQVGSYVFPLALVATLAVLWIKRCRGALAAALFFVGTLFPVMGFLSLYGFLFSYVADHWQYLSCLGLIALAAAGLSGWLAKRSAVVRGWGRAGCFALLVILGGLSWRMTLPYDNPLTFYATIVEKNPAAWMARNNLGVQLMTAARPAEAIVQYREALQLRPQYFEAENNLGQALDSVGDTAQAAVHYRRAVELNPMYAGAYVNLGNALFTLGKVAEAGRSYRQALVLAPETYQASYNLAVILAQQRRFDEAIIRYERALQVKPDYAEAHFNLGALLGETGRLAEAIAHYEAALKIQPTAEAHNNLGNALLTLGRLEDAATQFKAALALDPKLAAAHLNLALACRRLGRQEEAQFHALQARLLNGPLFGR
jgi:tetratricopeptide (TPR) repeat protein